MHRGFRERRAVNRGILYIMLFNKKALFVALVGFVFSFLVFSTIDASASEKPPVLIGFDGEFGLKNSTSAQAIELGIRAGIHEINKNGGVLGGRLRCP